MRLGWATFRGVGQSLMVRVLVGGDRIIHLVEDGVCAVPIARVVALALLKFFVGHWPAFPMAMLMRSRASA